MHGGYSMNSNLSAQQNQILSMFATNRTDTGAGIHDVAKESSLPLLTVKKIVEYLCEEALLYSTIDDEHFKSTES